jgi:transcriptional regulator with XRE-family HTH domain
MPLNSLLKQFRIRINPDVAKLGSYERLPSRRGRTVTQRELSELLGVSRTWYAALECNAQARTSLALLDRLADLFMVSPQERAALFESAFPEVGRRSSDSVLQLEVPLDA